MRLIGAVLFKADDDWQTSNSNMMIEAFALIHRAMADTIPAPEAAEIARAFRRAALSLVNA